MISTDKIEKLEQIALLNTQVNNDLAEISLLDMREHNLIAASVSASNLLRGIESNLILGVKRKDNSIDVTTINELIHQYPKMNQVISELASEQLYLSREELSENFKVLLSHCYMTKCIDTISEGIATEFSEEPQPKTRYISKEIDDDLILLVPDINEMRVDALTELAALNSRFVHKPLEAINPSIKAPSFDRSKNFDHTQSPQR